MTKRAPHIERFWASDWSLTVLLFLLLGHFFLLAPLRELEYDVTLLTHLAFTVLLLSGIVAVAPSRLAACAFGAVALVALGVHWTYYVTGDTGLLGPATMASVIACGLLSGIVLAEVFRAGPITLRRIQGAIAAYLLIALMFAAVYMWIDIRTGGAFGGAVPPRDAVLHPTARFAYFSFVTLTTVGYGDIVPVHPFARSMAMCEALIGQLFPAVLLARLVSMQVAGRRRGDDAPG